MESFYESYRRDQRRVCHLCPHEVLVTLCLLWVKIYSSLPGMKCIPLAHLTKVYFFKINKMFLKSNETALLLLMHCSNALSAEYGLG